MRVEIEQRFCQLSLDRGPLRRRDRGGFEVRAGKVFQKEEGIRNDLPGVVLQVDTRTRNLRFSTQALEAFALARQRIVSAVVLEFDDGGKRRVLEAQPVDGATDTSFERLGLLADNSRSEPVLKQSRRLCTRQRYVVVLRCLNGVRHGLPAVRSKLRIGGGCDDQ